MASKKKNTRGSSNSPSTPDDSQGMNRVEVMQRWWYKKFLMDSEEASPALKEFVQEFLILCDPSSPRGVSMGAYLRRHFKQFYITDQNEFDVLVEVYLRAYKFLMPGGTQIVHPTAWTKRTAYHVIRELNRRPNNSKEFVLDEQILDKNAVALTNQADSLKTDITVLKHALASLTLEEQRLLILKIVHELRWNEIRKILLQDGKVIPGNTPEKQEASLRKMKERALKHLRANYYALCPLSELEEED